MINKRKTITLIILIILFISVLTFMLNQDYKSKKERCCFDYKINQIERYGLHHISVAEGLCYNFRHYLKAMGRCRPKN